MTRGVVFVILSLFLVHVDSACQVTNCANECNGFTCTKCLDGYYLNGQGLCTQCPQHCATCSNSVYCLSCEPQYWNLGINVKCNEPCSTNCASIGCNDSDGHCYECIPGKYGQMCDYECSLCLDGECERKKCTKRCKDGYTPFGSEYIFCTSCSENCKTCSNTTYCTQCEPGYYSDYFRVSSGRGTMKCLQCDEQCTQCNPTDQCPGWCQIECIQQGCVSGNCVTKTTSTPITTKKTTQELVTPKPQDETPKQSDANTTQAPSTESPTTEQTTEPLQTDASQQKADDNSTIIGAAAGGGAFVLLVVVVVFLVCFIKRRSKKSDSRQDEGNVNNDIKVDAVQDIPIYARPMKKSKPEDEPPPQDNLYAQPVKKIKTHTHHTKSEIGEPQRVAYSNIVFDLDNDNTSVTMGETNVDDIQLEDVDEGRLTTDIDMGNNIPSSDTYYNMEGLVRSQVKVSQLLDYVRKKTDFEAEFKRLPDGLQRSCNEALKPNNRKNNRYNGIYAYDATRVVLESKTYINANYIDGHNQSRAYIASLGPTADTMNEYATFWEMVWQHKTEAIVMLTNLKEGSKMKCEQYWPRRGMVMNCGKYSVSCVAEKWFAEFVVREFTLQCKGSKDDHNVSQYHYTAWPDRSVPDSVTSLVAFRDKVEQQQRAPASPLIVHCSAGIGRTGTYIALDILIKQGRDEDFVDLFGCALGLRGQRVKLIQNETQYEYLHQCVLYALTCDTEPVGAKDLCRQITEDRIAQQYKAMVALDSVIKRQSLKPNLDRKENRKGSDIPDDQYRVQLVSPRGGYINAVYINGYARINQYITTQTPLPSTITEFISMIDHEKVQCIVCLDDEHETDKTVGQYLPEDYKTSKFGRYTIKCASINMTKDFIIRELKVTEDGTPSFQDRIIRHYQYRGWKSGQHVPPDTKSFLKLLVDVNKNLDKQKSDCPILVHCLTGSVRSGIYCAVATMMEVLVIESQITGIHYISHVRDRRHSAIQNQEMFTFCYDCVKCLIDLSENDPYYNLHSLGQ